MSARHPPHLTRQRRRGGYPGEAATEGPWENCRGFVRSLVHGSEMAAPGFTVATSSLWVAECRDGEAFYNPDGNAEFIAHARTDIPYLLSALQSALAENEELQMALDFQGGDLMQRDERLATLTAELRVADTIIADLNQTVSSLTDQIGKLETQGLMQAHENATLTAECERQGAALSDCADDLEAYVEDHYKYIKDHPAMKWRYERDMAPVKAARALQPAAATGGEG